MMRSGWRRFILPLAIATLSCQISSNAALASGHFSSIQSKSSHVKPPSKGCHHDRIHSQPMRMSSNDDTSPMIIESDPQQTKLTLQKASSLLSTFSSMAYPCYRKSQAGRHLFIGMIVRTDEFGCLCCVLLN
jgi:hypothetical protein